MRAIATGGVVIALIPLIEGRAVRAITTPTWFMESLGLKGYSSFKVG
jgi:hypothetical protein